MTQIRKYLSAAVLAFMACGRGAELDTAEDADEATTVTYSESALTTELSDELMQPQSAAAEDLANAAATRVKSRAQPASCLTTSINGATVVYVFNDCTGPYGLVHVTGTVTAVYSRPSGGGVQVVLTGDDVHVNASTIHLDATVTATMANGVKTAQVTSNIDGVGPRGGALARQGQYTVTYDATSGCVTLNGTWTSTAAARTSSTVVTGYQRCQGTCPSSGGSVVHTSGSTVVTLAYDGSSTAQWTTKAGRSGTVTLQCQR